MSVYAPLMDRALDELIFETLDAQERDTLVALLDRVRERALSLLECDPPT